MHWLHVFFLAWVSVGFATIGSLFWLCKRTAATMRDAVKAGSLPQQSSEFGANDLSNELGSA
jgi:hypothetical protein